MRKKMKGLAKVWPKNKKARIVAVVLTGIFFFGGAYFLVHAQEIIDSFTDLLRVDDTWNVEVDTTSGVVKLEGKTCDDGTWDCADNNVCSNTLGDGDYIVVADADLGTTYQWKTANTACDKPQCSQDGGQSGDNLVADNTVSFSDYPARDACKSLGGRLPTVAELTCIYNNQATFGNNFGTDYHWSSTEYDSGCAWTVYFNTGDVIEYCYKPALLSVRCVMGW